MILGFNDRLPARKYQARIALLFTQCSSVMRFLSFRFSALFALPKQGNKTAHGLLLHCYS